MGAQTGPATETRPSAVHGGSGWIGPRARAGRTGGRPAGVCGQRAFTIRASPVGATMGPPADIEYAVEPVGVLTMMPSAEYCATSSPSTATLRRTTRATPPLWTTTSFSTRGSTLPPLAPLPVIVVWSASLGSVVDARRA